MHHATHQVQRVRRRYVAEVGQRQQRRDIGVVLRMQRVWAQSKMVRAGPQSVGPRPPRRTLTMKNWFPNPSTSYAYTCPSTGCCITPYFLMPSSACCDTTTTRRRQYSEARQPAGTRGYEARKTHGCDGRRRSTHACLSQVGEQPCKTPQLDDRVGIGRDVEREGGMVVAGAEARPDLVVLTPSRASW